jgi:hypothetical protein
MISSAETISTTRAQATELFARAKLKSGSKMVAYADVAKAVGTSAGWIRKFIKSYEAKEPKAGCTKISGQITKLFVIASSKKMHSI